MKDIKIFIAGDFCPVGRNEQKFIDKDFAAVESIKSVIAQSDYAVVNLEVPLTETEDKIKKSGPNIRASPKTVEALKFLGVDLVTLANNHILDSDEKGVLDTIKVCEGNDIQTVGAGTNLSSARKAHYTKIKDRKIAILNFAENEFCAATETVAGANPINDITNFYDIRNAKSESDLVIVIVHGGREHYQLPTPKQRERFRFYAEAGADLVVGHHTHCFSGYEIYKDTPIFYSLGNFIFDYKKKYQKGKWTEGYAVLFSIDDHISFELVPFKQGREENPNLVLLNKTEEESFYSKIEELNKIITNDQLFNIEWQKYLKSEELNYSTMLTIQNKYIRAAVNRKLIPSFPIHDQEHLLLLFNLMRCETHREITTAILAKKFENER